MTIVFTVTNDLSYDQRMHRICGTLAENGYQVCLVGRSLPHSIPLTDRPFRQKRLRCFFRKGFLFYKEYNLRLLWFLLFARYDAVCSADLDTLAAGWLATVIRRKKRASPARLSHSCRFRRLSIAPNCRCKETGCVSRSPATRAARRLCGGFCI